MKRILTALALFFFAASALTFADGSLADAAKKEKERRAKITKPAKVITNKDIEDFKASGKVVGGTIETTSGEGETQATEQASDKTAAKQEEKTADQWNTDLANAQNKVKEAQNLFDQLQARAASNTYYQGNNQLTGQGATDANQLADAKQALEDAKSNLETLQTQARYAGIAVPHY